MYRSLLLLAAVLWLAAPVAAQEPEVRIERDGSRLTITLPDGTKQTFEVDERAVLRLEDGRDRRAVVLRRGPLAEREPQLAWRGRVVPYGGALDAQLDSLLAALPGQIEARVARLNMPRVWFEGDGAREARREALEADRRAQRLALEVRRAEREGDEAEAARLRAELREALEEAFELHQRARREQAADLRRQQAVLDERAAEIEQDAARRERNRQAIIERRERVLLGQRDELDW